MADRKQLILKVIYPSNTTAERLCEVLGDALYYPDIAMLQPLPEEYEKDDTHWDLDNIHAEWEISDIEES